MRLHQDFLFDPLCDVRCYNCDTIFQNCLTDFIHSFETDQKCCVFNIFSAFEHHMVKILGVDGNQDSFPPPIKEVGRGKGCEAHLTFDLLKNLFQNKPHLRGFTIPIYFTQDSLPTRRRLHFWKVSSYHSNHTRIYTKIRNSRARTQDRIERKRS